MDLFETLAAIGIVGFVDIFLMSLLLYAALVWLKRKRAFFVLTGIVICGLVYLLAHQFNLSLISWVLRGFFAVILIAMVVIFQEELRHVFELVAVWSLNRRLKRRKATPVARREVENLVRTLTDLARRKIGALVVIRGRDLLLGHLEGGVHLDGVMSEPLLHSIFDPHSTGHDGAVIVERDRILQFGAHLPLSNDFQQLAERGTRHAAALGIAEVSDALSLVVSEERGQISVAQSGRLRVITDPEQLTFLLVEHYRRLEPEEKARPWRDLFKKNYREKLIAVAMSFALWFVLVYESRLVHESFHVPVEYPPLPKTLTVKSVRPPKVTVTFSGPRNVFHFINDKSIRLSLPLLRAKPGRERVVLTESHLKYPKSIVFEQMSPPRVVVEVGERPAVK